ncbi:MAG: GTP cyclohydrolase FolE2 [Gammaproteobacteria bacterium]
MDWEVTPPIIPSGIEDVQAQRDERRMAIDAVGISHLKLPIKVEDAGEVQYTVAEVRCAVELPPERRGTHMSRFVALLADDQTPVSARTLPALLSTMAERLEAKAAEIEFVFPFFKHKQAPVSGVASPMDYKVRLGARLAGGTTLATTDITVPVTSLCPCSKEISAYGAHNQRSHVRVSVEGADCGIGELIALVESEASAPLYGLLKRADEKRVTEQAYENPKFVEDMVRDVALRLKVLSGIGYFRVEVENFESIHNHSAYAVIEGTGVDS